MQITVFTPTYNRAYRLASLYESLVIQSNKNFEWLIIDDGSTDDTKKLIDEWKQANRIKIRYERQENSGKHIAINSGVKLAKGKLFFIVDSDDYLERNAIERIIFHYHQIEDNDEFCGVSGLRAYPDGSRIGGEVNFNTLDCSAFDLRYTFKIKGDMAEVYKTNILKKYPFPKIENEKFCTEAVVWNRIAQKYYIRYFAEKTYICEYLPDGLSHNYLKTHINSPKYTMLYYMELSNYNISLFKKYKAVLSFWRFSFNDKDYSFLKKIKKINSLFSLIAIPLGYMKYRKDKIKKKSNAII